MTFDREPDLDNANVGTPIICIIRGSYLRNQVASVFCFYSEQSKILYKKIACKLFYIKYYFARYIHEQKESCETAIL